MKSFIIIIGVDRDFFLHWLTFFLCCEWEKFTNDPINVNVQSMFYWNSIEFLAWKKNCDKKISEHQSICQNFLPFVRYTFQLQVRIFIACWFLLRLYLCTHLWAWRKKKVCQQWKNWHCRIRIERRAHKKYYRIRMTNINKKRQQELNIPHIFGVFLLCDTRK